MEKTVLCDNVRHMIYSVIPVGTLKTNQRNLLDEFLENVRDDFCRVGNFAPWLIESAGVMCNISGIPN